jgi:predicted DNA-binding protein (MmcQ/YjbR family)
MRYVDVESLCLSLPGTSVHTPWGQSRVYKVGGKMFAMLAYGDASKPQGIWFKAGEASFQILTRVKGISPCPYLARAHWVAMEGITPLKPKELKAYLIRAHALVAAGLSKKTRMALGIKEVVTDREANPFL